MKLTISSWWSSNSFFIDNSYPHLEQGYFSFVAWLLKKFSCRFFFAISFARILNISLFFLLLLSHFSSNFSSLLNVLLLFLLGFTVAHLCHFFPPSFLYSSTLAISGFALLFCEFTRGLWKLRPISCFTEGSKYSSKGKLSLTFSSFIWVLPFHSVCIVLLWLCVINSPQWSKGSDFTASIFSSTLVNLSCSMDSLDSQKCEDRDANHQTF